MCVGHEVFEKVDDNNSLIVGDPRGILGQQFRPCPAHLLNIIIIILKSYLFNYYLF